MENINVTKTSNVSEDAKNSDYETIYFDQIRVLQKIERYSHTRSFNSQITDM